MLYRYHDAFEICRHRVVDRHDIGSGGRSGRSGRHFQSQPAKFIGLLDATTHEDRAPDVSDTKPGFLATEAAPTALARRPRGRSGKRRSRLERYGTMTLITVASF